MTYSPGLSITSLSNLITLIFTLLNSGENVHFIMYGQTVHFFPSKSPIYQFFLVYFLPILYISILDPRDQPPFSVKGGYEICQILWAAQSVTTARL